ncbi:MAG: hypothetical protein ACK5ZV_05880 [bacterium]|jgi:hypothetical protein
MQFQFVGGKPVRVGVHFLPVERADHGRHDATNEALHDDLRVGTAYLPHMSGDWLGEAGDVRSARVMSAGEGASVWRFGRARTWGWVRG